MSETRYMISDMAKKVDVEAHVLRYWEEELDIGVSRTELGHRYYTEEDIRLFRKIKELKERGLQLKAIKVLVPELKKKEAESLEKEDTAGEKIIVLEKKKSEKEQAETLPAIRTSLNSLRVSLQEFSARLSRIIMWNWKDGLQTAWLRRLTYSCRFGRNGKKSGSAGWMRRFGHIRKTASWWRQQKNLLLIRKNGVTFLGCEKETGVQCALPI